MATVNCPHGSRWISQVNKNSFFEFRDVSIFNDVCESSNRCGISDCEFYDNSKEAAKLYWKGLCRSHGLIEEQEAEKAYEKALRERLRKSSERYK